ncbi:MAG TPA: TetR family transcriptional regulator C-terminal domain-containing protein [Herpetosiphonaceae bacterium]
MPKPNVREKLLAAGLECLHEHGFNATGVQDITEAAGVPKGSFYNHFASKEALGVEAVRRYVELNTQRMQILADASIAPLARLRAYFESLAETIEQLGYQRGCLLGNFGTELASQSQLIRESTAAGLAGWTDAIALVIREAQAAGAVPAHFAPQALAGFIINAWEGAIVRARVDQSRDALDGFLSLTFAKILA